MYKKSEIKLFFYGILVEIIKFKLFFVYLGCVLLVIFLYYVLVFDMLYGWCKVNVLDLNEVESVLRVMKGFFEMM